MNLHTLSFAPGSIKKEKRIARGGCRGGSSGRGHNGAKSRSGYSSKRNFEGGQLPLQRRVPKYGFKNFNRVEYKALNVDSVDFFANKLGGGEFTRDMLVAVGLVKKNEKYKILGMGDIKNKVVVYAHSFSESAKEKIKNVGGDFRYLEF